MKVFHTVVNLCQGCLKQPACMFQPLDHAMHCQFLMVRRLLDKSHTTSQLLFTFKSLFSHFFYTSLSPVTFS